MVICKYTDPNISLALIPYFIDTEKTKLEIGWELHERLRNNPEDTFCLVGTEDNVIHGMLIAYLREKDAFLWQVMADSKFSKYSRIGYSLFEDWARRKGRSEIRGKPLKELPKRYYCRRYGYKPDGEEIVKSLSRGNGQLA